MFTYWTRDGSYNFEDFNCIPIGKLHREDGPAIIGPNEYEAWFVNGKRHRIGGPALITQITKSNRKIWYVDGLRHRVDGPAIIEKDGRVYWCLNGTEYTLEDYFKYNNKLTEDQKMLIKLIWG